MRRFACLRGSSDDDRPDRARSCQSTPRMHRYKVRDISHDSQRSVNSVNSMDPHRIQRLQRESSSDREREKERIKLLNRSWDAVEHERVHCDRHRERTPPRGMDRAWEVERTRGLELMYRSLEKEKERRSHKDRERSRGHGEKSRDRHGKRDKNDVSKELLDRRLDELNRQLQEEKQHSRKDKLTIAKLQREIARNKSEGPVRESLMRELERERMLRVDAEQRLREMTLENDACKSQLSNLQGDFKKMDDMVHGMLQYKTKMEQLKQEKTKLTVTYENAIQKYKGHVTNLEQDNQLLLAEVKKIESQCANCQICNKDLSYRVNNKEGPGAEDQDRVKVLMERLRQLETENSALVLEGEQQRGQYDKCLDDIANQVVQALLSQKSLREECLKLQRRVADLEQQNQQLSHMFQQRLRFTSDTLLQAFVQRQMSGDRSPQGSQDSSHSLPLHAQHSLMMAKAAAEQAAAAEEQVASSVSMESFNSLQSICSDYNENMSFEENLGQPQMSSPPPWLRDKLFPGGMHTPNRDLSPGRRDRPDHSPSRVETRIETLFPATNTSPKMQHITEHRHASNVSAFSLVRPKDSSVKTVPKKNTIEHQVVIECTPDQLSDCAEVESNSTNHDKQLDASVKHSNSTHCSKPVSLGQEMCASIDMTCARSNQFDASPGKELLKLSDSFDEKYLISDKDGLSVIKKNTVMLDSSSEDEEAKTRLSNMLNIGSNISLNELLEREITDVVTPVDEVTDDFLSGGDDDQCVSSKSQKSKQTNNRASKSGNSKTASKSLLKSQSEDHSSQSENRNSLKKHKSLPNNMNKTTLVPKPDVPCISQSKPMSLTGTGDVGLVLGLGRGRGSFPMLDCYDSPLGPGIVSSKAHSDKNVHFLANGAPLGKNGDTVHHLVETAETDSERSTSTVSQRSTLSPDSMHQSFTSSSGSDHVLSDKPSGRDDGYSSMSMSSSDTHLSNISDKTRSRMQKVQEQLAQGQDRVTQVPQKKTPACHAKERHPRQLYGISASKSSLQSVGDITIDDNHAHRVMNIRAFFESKTSNSSKDTSGGKISQTDSVSDHWLPQGAKKPTGLLKRSEGNQLNHCSGCGNSRTSAHRPTAVHFAQGTSKSETCLLQFLSKNRRSKFMSRKAAYLTYSQKVYEQQHLRRTFSDTDISQFETLAVDMTLHQLTREYSVSLEHLPSMHDSSADTIKCNGAQLESQVYHVAEQVKFRIPTRPGTEGSEFKDRPDNKQRPEAAGKETTEAFVEPCLPDAQYDLSGMEGSVPFNDATSEILSNGERVKVPFPYYPGDALDNREIENQATFRPLSYRDYVNLEWIRAASGEMLPVRICHPDNGLYLEQDFPADRLSNGSHQVASTATSGATDCDLEDDLEGHTSSVNSANSTEVQCRKRPESKTLPTTKQPDKQNSNHSRSLPKDAARVGASKVVTNGTYLYQNGGKHFSKVNSLELPPKNSSGAENHKATAVVKPHNKFLDSVRRTERQNKGLSNASIDSQASFEMLSDTCCEDYSTQSDEN